MSRTAEQKRATAAWAAIEAASQSPAFAKYVPLAQAAPVHIRTSGFGQTVAFYLSRTDKPEYNLLLSQLAAWVLPPEAERPDASQTGRDLMVAIQGSHTPEYRRLMAEAMAYLVWLKRFAAGHPKAPKKAKAATHETDA